MSRTDMDSDLPNENHAQLNSVTVRDSRIPIIQNLDEESEQSLTDYTDEAASEDDATEEISEEENNELHKAKILNIPVFHDAKVEKINMSIANWIMMNELPFSIVEDEGYNIMLRQLNPEWSRISEATAKSYCVKIYEMEKKRLKILLENVDRISLTMDSWKSKIRKRSEYKVITGHWIDQNWQLQKRVLGFLDVRECILDVPEVIQRCLEEWGIESKVHTVSSDSNTPHDYDVHQLKAYIKSKRRLLFLGKLFHVLCYDDTLGMIAQYRISEIENIIDVVRDGVRYVLQANSDIEFFSEIVEVCYPQGGILIDDNGSGWKSTYEMLDAAVKFKQCFWWLKERDLDHQKCPSDEDWEIVEKTCLILKILQKASDSISRSDYPTSNSFLFEATEVKEALDKMSLMQNDEIMQGMVERSKLAFDAYWNHSVLLMSIATVLDPRCRMWALKFCYQKVYSSEKADSDIEFVRLVLHEIYTEYKAMHDADGKSRTKISSESTSGWSQYVNHLSCLESIQPRKSELDMYLEESCSIADIDKGRDYDVLEWWKMHSFKYKILSRMARDILSIPMNTASCDATSRVIDKYCASSTSDMVRVVMCGGDWLRKYIGVKNKFKSVKSAKQVIFPVDVDDGSSEG